MNESPSLAPLARLAAQFAELLGYKTANAVKRR